MQRIKVTLVSSDGRVAAYVAQQGEYIPPPGQSYSRPGDGFFGLVIKLELVMDVPNNETMGFQS